MPMLFYSIRISVYLYLYIYVCHHETSAPDPAGIAPRLLSRTIAFQYCSHFMLVCYSFLFCVSSSSIISHPNSNVFILIICLGSVGGTPSFPPFLLDPLSFSFSLSSSSAFTPYSLPILFLVFFNSFLDVLFSCFPSLYLLSLVLFLLLHRSSLGLIFPPFPFFFSPFSLFSLFSFFLVVLIIPISRIFLFSAFRVQINWLVFLNLALHAHSN